MSRPFRFKQFTIHQDHAPMKVGTDGVLLGAWAGTGSPKRILDIGTGTGMIALMMAQRFPEALITALEPNEDALLDATHNFNVSPFSDRLNLQKSALQDFRALNSFDLIVSNPPFFRRSLVSQNKGREQARHANTLSIEELSTATDLLNEDGRIAVIYPVAEYEQFKSVIALKGFSENRVTLVKPTPSKDPHRIMGEFSKALQKTEKSELVIEKDGRHNYSREYKMLTEAFYL